MTEQNDDRVFHVDGADLERSDVMAGVDRRGFRVRPAHLGGDFNTAVAVMGLTAKEMNSTYTETAERRLAVSVVVG